MDATKSCGSKACTVLLKTLLLTFNAIFLLIGVLLLAIGVYGLTGTNVLFLPFTSTFNIYIPFFCIGLFMVFVGALALWCTPKGVTWMLYFYGVIVFLLFVVVFSLSALLVVRHDAVERSLKVGIAKSIDNYSNDKRAMDTLQKTLSCCGSQNYTDWMHTTWFNQTQSIPQSCCRLATSCGNKLPNITDTDLFDKGCFDLMEGSIKRYYSAMGGIGFASSILIFFGSILSCSLSRNIQRIRYEQLE